MPLPMRAWKAGMKAEKAKAAKKVMMKIANAKLMKKVMKKGMKIAKKKKTKEVSKIASGQLAKWGVFRGSLEKSATDLRKSDLVMRKKDKIVYHKRHASGKKTYAHIKAWTMVCQTAHN
ncbi:unnamed protein product [Polarella glacialis]|uniref:Uncharacterized protein n=1 Tax=Polarella glacialis TaxID=89957 RepID=A0A813E149_POLGL|nr:unnamed protein product [Polarella glacialis]